MIKLARKHVTLNSLWSLFYCLLAFAAHVYLVYLCLTKYEHHRNSAEWNTDGHIPPEVTAYVALVILSLIFLPFFIFASILKIGNNANDGAKLGRDHALDTNTNTLGGKIGNEAARRLWQLFPPFSAVFHMAAAFFILLSEVIMTSSEIKHGLRPTADVWGCQLDFLFATDRAVHSDLIGQSNLTVAGNTSYFVVPFPIAPSSDLFNDQSAMTVSFLYLAAALVVFAVRYASVFWFTNKVFGLIYATQLLLMTVESLFALSGATVLYKVVANFGKYSSNIDLVLNPGAVITLLIFSGIILLLSSMAVYMYGEHYFHEKFKLIDQKHHPDLYRKETVAVQGSCQGYKTHTFAMVSLVSIAVFKGPILYDLVSVYRVTKDTMVLTCVIVDVCYMVSWIVLWTLLTLKHQWTFRILDYVPLNKPVFMISNEDLIRSSSIHGGSCSGSIDTHDGGRRKRPSSLPSDVTASESGFGDVNSLEDERFEIRLPPLQEVPGIVSSRRKGSTHSLDRKSRGRRNGNQRVTFHETVKRSTSTDDEFSPRRRGRPLNVTADVHQASENRPPSGGRLTPIELSLFKGQEVADIDSVSDTREKRSSLNNTQCRSSPSEENAARLERKDSSPKQTFLTFKDLNNKNEFTNNAKANLKSSNMQTQTVLNNAAVKTNNTEGDNSPLSSPTKSDNPNLSMRRSRDMTLTNQLFPRPVEYMDKTHELSRRDSANYSLTSSQDTASNDSEHLHHHGNCSQV